MIQWQNPHRHYPKPYSKFLIPRAGTPRHWQPAKYIAGSHIQEIDLDARKPFCRTHQANNSRIKWVASLDPLSIFCYPCAELGLAAPHFYCLCTGSGPQLDSYNTYRQCNESMKRWKQISPRNVKMKMTQPGSQNLLSFNNAAVLFMFPLIPRWCCCPMQSPLLPSREFLWSPSLSPVRGTGT